MIIELTEIIQKLKVSGKKRIETINMNKALTREDLEASARRSPR